MVEEKKEALKVTEAVPAQVDEMSLRRESALEKWIPKTSLGKKFFQVKLPASTKSFSQERKLLKLKSSTSLFLD